MSQTAKTRKKSTQRNSNSASAPAPVKPVDTTPDPALEKQITKLVSAFMVRILISFFIVALLIEYGIRQAKVSPQNTLPLIAAATFGIMFPFVRGAAKVFKEIKRLGIERLEKRKYADAQFALDYFHRFGQMSFDPTGEAHYHLIRAHIGLGNMEKARDLVVWMQKHRRLREWTTQAATALETAERKLNSLSPLP